MSDAVHRRVLVVDDDDLVRTGLARLLQGTFDIVTAVDAGDALAKIGDDLHAVITDHDLGPGKPNGRTVLAEVRRRVPTARRLLVSGERRRLNEGEADLWDIMLVKPIFRDELFDALGVVRKA
jgi:CheY-like chemotaxis protein